jgi:hypothetical protein
MHKGDACPRVRLLIALLFFVVAVFWLLLASTDVDTTDGHGRPVPFNTVLLRQFRTLFRL